MRKRRGRRPILSGPWLAVTTLAILAVAFAITSGVLQINPPKVERLNYSDIPKSVVRPSNREATHVVPDGQRGPASPPSRYKTSPSLAARSPSTQAGGQQSPSGTIEDAPPFRDAGIESLSFAEWREELWPESRDAGISRGTFDKLLGGVEPDLSLPDLVIPGRRASDAGGQAEFIKTPAAYIDEKSIRRLADQGRAKLKKHKQLLAKIEKRFGVSRHVVLAIWGRESAYSKYRFRQNAIRSLATQAYAGRRRRQFRKELIIALSLVERGVVNSAKMRSSWAGAMGPTQFMPSDYDKYAVSFAGRGQADPWESLPDALASAANQLRKNGWNKGEPWGYEVQMADTADCTLATPDLQKSLLEWDKLGVKPVAQRPSGDSRANKTSLLMPAGAYGPAFLTTQNFLAIKAYNFSELYALFVAHLADRIAGRRAFAKRWQNVALLRAGEVKEIQKYLKDRELYLDKLDGKAGSKTRAAVGVYQKANDLHVDCWPTKGTILNIRKSLGLRKNN